MTDLGLIPSLYHLEEHSLQEHTLLHLCVIVSNLAEMFFVVTLAKRLYSLLFLPYFLLLLFSLSLARVRVQQEFCFFAVTSVTVDGVGSTSSSPKTTSRFTENDVSFC